MTIGLYSSSSCLDCGRQVIQHLDRGLEGNTCVRDRDAVFEMSRAFGRDTLLAFIDVRFDHDANDMVVSSLELVRDALGDLGLVAVVLARVTVRAVDHDVRPQTGLGQVSLGLRHEFGSIVGSGVAATKNDMAVRVAGGVGDADGAALGDAEEMVWRRGRANGINGNPHVTVRAVLEPDRERHARRQFTVQLRFGRARANGAPRNQIRQVLW